MRFILGFLLALLGCSIGFPVQAANFGLSPASVEVKISPGETQQVNFKIVGYSGLVDISVENMPVTLVSPSSSKVVAGSDISVKIRCNDNVLTGSYNGKIVFLAKSGSSVQSGIKVICKLTVTGVLGNKGGLTADPGVPVTIGSSNSSTNDDERNVSISPEIVSDTIVTNPEPSEMESTVVQNNDKNEFNWLFFVLAIVVCSLFIWSFVAGYKWMQRRKI